MSEQSDLLWHLAGLGMSQRWGTGGRNGRNIFLPSGHKWYPESCGRHRSGGRHGHLDLGQQGFDVSQRALGRVTELCQQRDDVRKWKDLQRDVHHAGHLPV